MRFPPRQLDLAQAEAPLRSSALIGIRAEQRAEGGTRALEIEAVEPIGEDAFLLRVGLLDGLRWDPNGADVWAPAGPELTPGEGPTLWRGVVLEVAAEEGGLVIGVEENDPAPRPGPCWIKPPSMWAPLVAVLDDPPAGGPPRELDALLQAARGGGGARAGRGTLGGALDAAWDHAWGLVWGPPGTGKTHQLAAQVSRAVEAGERVLAVSSTNRSSDDLALRIGARLPERVRDGQLVRIGARASGGRYREPDLVAMLQPAELDLRFALEELAEALRRARSAAERVSLLARLRKLYRTLAAGSRPFVDPRLRLVVTTAAGALRQLASADVQSLMAQGGAPFDTVVVDEAGQLGRAQAAALGLYAARRVLLAGDPRQLAPISRAARLVRPEQATWLEESALGHLRPGETQPGLVFLDEQYRMAPAIRLAVSEAFYAGRLRDAPAVARRVFAPRLEGPVVNGPAAVWLVLDEDAGEKPHIRAERGARGKSWQRRRSLELFARLLDEDPAFAAGPGLFLSPFRAQVEAAQALLSRLKLPGWTASTVHAQQGAEADRVVFDTVNAGSTGWPLHEWERLINVGLSRAREQLILLASVAELRQPFLAPLAGRLTPAVFRRGVWRRLPLPPAPRAQPTRLHPAPPGSLGAQLAQRRALLPVPSALQEQLVQRVLDDGPRLVRGLAGSGKTAILAAWVARELSEASPELPVLVVYGNQALGPLLQSQISEAWRSATTADFPNRHLRCQHANDLLREEALRAGLPAPRGAGATETLLATLRASPPPPRFYAVFIDEAQDFDEALLAMIFRLARPPDPSQTALRRVRIFYDNAQNVYGRTTPNWSQLGLDLRGRSRVLDESYRSTRPILEAALNTLYAIDPPGNDPTHREYVERGLIVEDPARPGRFTVHFAPLDGIEPRWQLFSTPAEEAGWVAREILSLIDEQGLLPQDIRVLCFRNEQRQALAEAIGAVLAPLHYGAQSSKGDVDEAGVVAVSTPHSFKGHEAEVIFVVGVDRFVAAGRPQAHALFSSMTRARALLFVSGCRTTDRAGQRVLAAVAAACGAP